MSNLLKNGTYSIINQITGLVVALATGIIIARNLGPEGKGSVYLVTQTASLMSVFFSFGIGPSLLYHLKKDKISKETAFFLVLAHLILTNLILVTAYLLFKDPLLNLLNTKFSELYLIVIGVLISFNMSANLFGNILMRDSMGINRWALISSFSSLIYLIGLVIFIILFRFGLEGVFFALFISLTVNVLSLIHQIGRVRIRSLAFEFSLLGSIARYGLGIFSTAMFLTSLYRVDIFLVNSLLSVSELGVYSVAVNLSELLLIVPVAMGVVLFPYLSSLKGSEQNMTVALTSRLSFLLGIGGSVLVVLIGYPFIKFVFGEQFLNAYNSTLLLLPGLIAMTMNLALNNYAAAIGKPLVGGVLFAFGASVNVVLNLIFLKEFGINGAAFFSSVSYIITTYGFVLFVSSKSGLDKLELVIPQKSDLVFVKGKVSSFIFSK
ncbi:oligosaccharide flippase family protein [bacterium]|nr:oligosaccharide flippase family protein [bacterium]